MSRIHDELFDERVVPSGTNWADHVARYEYAASHIRGDARVLDAGAGTAYGARLLSLKAVAVDASLTALAAAQRDGARRLAAGDVTKLPFPDGSFDIVTCFEVIEHVPDPSELVRELARVIAPGGRAFVSTPNARIELAFDHSQGRERWEKHISPLTTMQLRRVMKEQFRNVELRGQSESCSWLRRAIKTVDVFGLRFALLRLRLVADPVGEQSAIRQNWAQTDAERAPTYTFSRSLAFGANQLLAIGTR